MQKGVGIPYTDFPDLIVLHSMNGLDVGEINRSKVFPAKFLPFVAKEVEGRVTNFLSTRMEQTGFLPAGKVCADKATSKHRSHHFISFITVIPDSEPVIQPIFLDVPLVKTHSGPKITNNIIQVPNVLNIIPEQYLGGAYDGQYFHLHVPELLDKHFGYEGKERKHSTWDPMHKAGLRDGRIRRDPEFAWLGKVTDVASTAFKVINWGKEFEHFYDVVTRLKNDPTSIADVFYGLPCFYSETKFTNHCVKLYKQLRKDFPGLIMTLEETQLEKAGGDARDRQKANDAAGIMNQLANRKMVVRLSGMCDIYETFENGVDVLQIVNMLPHDKYDNFFEKCVNKLEKMAAIAQIHELCLTLDKHSKKCLWPAYHADIEELNATGKYRGILLIDDHPEQNRTRHGSFLAQTQSLENVTSAVSNNLQKLAR
eukprot:Seg3933.2 transcript_id=Seg3933.2/GoldUCD/mRNA.D3Y31 product="hypothetical protein" protein_id=Seg3933.2/GoldUCD/D3Y31